jgi:very-short-patch-repair endonuclease
VDTRIARLAARQHGVVTAIQLYSCGLHPSVVSRRASTGRLTRIHRGVYAVGHPGLSQAGRWMAAVLACGEGAALSHQSAGALWEVLPVTSQIHVTVPGDGGRKRRDSITIHRSSTLLSSHCTFRTGIRVTKPARTLEDLRRVLSAKRFAQALREAQFHRLPIGDRFEPDRTRTELEARFLALCRRYRLPRPKVNARVGPFVVDFLYPARHLIVEVDGWESHRTRSAFEEDRARDARLMRLGWTVVRFTWRQLEDDPARVAATVRDLLL